MISFSSLKEAIVFFIGLPFSCSFLNIIEYYIQLPLVVRLSLLAEVLAALGYDVGQATGQLLTERQMQELVWTVGV